MKRAQSALELSFLIGVVAVAVTAMLVYINRGFQGNIRSSANQIGAGHYEPGSTTTATPTSEIKQVFSRIVSKSNTKVVYGTGGSESPAMQANRAEQDALRAELAGLEREKLGEPAVSDGTNPYLNQVAIDTAAGIANSNNEGINNVLTAAQRAQSVEDIDNAIEEVDGALTTLQNAYTNTQSARNTLANADYGCDGMPDSVRAKIASLDAAMAANLVQQGKIRTARADLVTKRQDVVDALDSGIDTSDTAITPLVTPVILDTPHTLEYINTRIGEINTRLSVLATAYTALAATWNNRVITPDTTTSTSSNIETGKSLINKTTSEKLESL